MISTGRTGDFQFTGFALSAHRNIHIMNMTDDKAVPECFHGVTEDVREYEIISVKVHF